MLNRLLKFSVRQRVFVLLAAPVLVGIEGKMFKPMAMTVIFALVGALALALT